MQVNKPKEIYIMKTVAKAKTAAVAVKKARRVTAAVAIMTALKGRKLGATAKELTARLNFAEKTVRNNLALFVKADTLNHTAKSKKCKVSGRAVKGYTSVSKAV